MSTVKEYATAKVIVAPTPATGGTSITVSNPAQFPDPATFGEYEVVLWPQAIEPTPNNHCEIVKVTAKTSVGDNAELTIVRAQNETFGLDVKQGWSVYNPALQGGGGGTTNYNDLSNKPKVNNVELSGDKTDKDLKLAGMADIAATFDNTNAYAVGDYFWYSDTLYRATKAIAVGGSVITSGANQNVVAVTVGPELTSLANKDNQQQEEINYSINTGAKNQLPNTGESKTHNGITFTKNADGTVTVNGTATGEAFYTVANNLKLSGRLKLTGCPAGGEANKYILAVKNNTSGEWLTPYDVGDGEVYDFDETAEYEVRFIIRSGQTLDNAIIKPMIRDNAITDDTYVPYGQNNADLTKQTASQQSQIDYNTNNGVKNILDTSHAKEEHSVIDYVNVDGSLTWKSVGVSTTYIGKAQLKKGVVYSISSDIVLAYGRIAISNSPDAISSQAGANAPDITMLSGATHWIYALRATGQIKESTFRANSDQTVYFWTGGDGTFTAPQTTKLMLRELNVGDSSYVPFALDNATLTNGVIDSNVITNNQKNLLRMGVLTQESSGITFSRNADGSVTISGVATGNAFYNLGNNGANKLTIKAGITYKLSNNVELPTGTALVMRKTASSATLLTIPAGSKEGTYTPTEDDTVFSYIQVYTGTDFTTPVTIYPMLRDARITDDSYVPPFDSGWMVLQTGILYRKTNGVVYINVSIPQAAIEEQTIGGWKPLNANNVLPLGFRPSSDNSIVPRNPVAFRKTSDNKFYFTVAQVNGAGQIQYSSETIGAVDNTTYNIIDFDVCYPLD